MIKTIRFIHTHFPIITKSFTSIFNFFITYIIKYRKKVITHNLKRSFPEKNEEIIKQIRQDFYRIFSNNFLEIIDFISHDKARILKHLTCDISNLDLEKGGIIMASHFGNWERNLGSLPIFISTPVLAFYKPLKSKYMNSLMQEIRGKFGVLVEPIDRTVRVLAGNKNKSIFYLFIADQGPVNMNGVYWNTFLNQRTPWLRGAEKLALKYQLPVYYAHQSPLEDGKYHLHFSLISDQTTAMDSSDIIESYSRLLEAEIKQNPSYWLWSHRRWKRANTESQQPIP
ncbi:MAG: lysophospholipid acyltransferase family protein [Saprospiraceae bacterium]